MPHAVSSARAVAIPIGHHAPAARHVPADGEARIPVPHAVMLTLGLSLALWGGIGLLAHWTLG
jgi:hypothetical protein